LQLADHAGVRHAEITFPGVAADALAGQVRQSAGAGDGGALGVS
jgi:hypothetical protein